MGGALGDVEWRVMGQRWSLYLVDGNMMVYDRWMTCKVDEWMNGEEQRSLADKNEV